MVNVCKCLFFYLIDREKNELMDALNKQRKLLADMRKRELEAYTQVKKSCEMVEQAQLEKHEVCGDVLK